MQITVDVPEQYLIDNSPVELGRRLKLYAALLIFQLGELSAGVAAEFAEVDRFTFASECQRRRIPTMAYPAEDLRAELDSLRRQAS